MPTLNEAAVSQENPRDWSVTARSCTGITSRIGPCAWPFSPSPDAPSPITNTTIAIMGAPAAIGVVAGQSEAGVGPSRSGSGLRRISRSGVAEQIAHRWLMAAAKVAGVVARLGRLPSRLPKKRPGTLARG